MANELKNFSDEDLLEELCRRQRKRLARDDRLEFRNCDECKHFTTWTKECDPPDSYNPCSKGHKMSFRMPDDWEAAEIGGYYRRVCGDRTPLQGRGGE